MDGLPGPFLQRLPPHADRPGGWLLEGARMDIPAQTIWQFISTSLDADPDAACIKCGDISLTRSQVRHAVQQIPALPKGGRIGLNMQRSIASVLLTLAIWKSGGVYVPIAPDYPLSRVQQITESCALDAIIADRPLDLAGYGPAVMLGDHAVYIHARTEGTQCPPAGGVCYIAHTSGSTGTPKGVKISDAALINRICCMRHFLEVQANDRIIYKTSSIFDVHLWEFVLPLAAGCLMVIYPQSRAVDLAEIARIMVDDSVTIAGFVPALLRLLLEMHAFVAHNTVRAVLCGGDAWGPGLAAQFHASLPGRLLYNSYGPAETTIAVANWPVPDAADLDAICLGGPLQNLLYLIEEDAPAAANPAGHVIGALCVGGAQVALGYVDGDDRHRFFEQSINGNQIRFYRTGDMVQLDPACGSVQFRGRQDNQVKVNGVRIELEEIERAVCGIAMITGCVAFVMKADQATKLCVAYTTACGTSVAPSEIRRICASRLPTMFIPTRMVQVAQLPLAVNGKVDRSAVVAGLRA